MADGSDGGNGAPSSDLVDAYGVRNTSGTYVIGSSHEGHLVVLHKDPKLNVMTPVEVERYEADPNKKGVGTLHLADGTSIRMDADKPELNGKPAELLTVHQGQLMNPMIEQPRREFEKPAPPLGIPQRLLSEPPLKPMIDVPRREFEEPVPATARPAHFDLDPNTPHLLPQPFQSMREGFNDPEETKAVQRFLLRVGGPSIAMKLMPGGADGKFDARMAEAVGMYQDKFVTEPHERGVLDIATSRSMSEMRAELAGQDRRPDAVAHIVSQIPDMPLHHLEHSTEVYGKLRSAQLYAVDATAHGPQHKPSEQEVMFMQEVLQSRGYNLGPAGIDGKPGKFFNEALRDYQRDAGLLPVGLLKSGGLDPATHELMKMDDDTLQRHKMEHELERHKKAPTQDVSALSSSLSDLMDSHPSGAAPAEPAAAAPAVAPPPPPAAPANPVHAHNGMLPPDYGGEYHYQRSPYMPQHGSGGLSIQVNAVITPGHNHRSTGFVRINFRP